MSSRYEKVDIKLKYIFGYMKIKLSTELTALYESYKLRLKAAEYVIQMHSEHLVLIENPENYVNFI